MIAFLLIALSTYISVALNMYIVRKRKIAYSKKFANLSGSIIIVCGSGGHTTEILRLWKGLHNRLFTDVYFIVASSDSMSENKIIAVEALKREQYPKEMSKNNLVLKVPRSREVGQSYFTSIFTTIWACIFGLVTIFKHNPNIILCNGPGTSISIVLPVFLLNILLFRSTCVIFVESICRVRSLSLTGKLLYHTRLADFFFVQWPNLTALYKRATYVGRLT